MIYAIKYCIDPLFILATQFRKDSDAEILEQMQRRAIGRRSGVKTVSWEERLK